MNRERDVMMIKWKAIIIPSHTATTIFFWAAVQHTTYPSSLPPSVHSSNFYHQLKRDFLVFVRLCAYMDRDIEDTNMEWARRRSEEESLCTVSALHFAFIKARKKHIRTPHTQKIFLSSQSLSCTSVRDHGGLRGLTDWAWGCERPPRRAPIIFVNYWTNCFLLWVNYCPLMRLISKISLCRFWLELNFLIN